MIHEHLHHYVPILSLTNTAMSMAIIIIIIIIITSAEEVVFIVVCQPVCLLATLCKTSKFARNFQGRLAMGQLTNY